MWQEEMGLQGVSHGEKETSLILGGEAKARKGENYGSGPGLSGASGDVEKMQG